MLLENAGGSQVPHTVIEAVGDYYRNSYVQLGVAYPESQRATATYNSAHDFMNTVMNGVQVGHTILGASTSVLCRMLADAYLEIMRPGDEVVVCETAHESNFGPWWRLGQHGLEIKTWRLDPDTFECRPSDLRALCNERTRIVAFPHVSNILGKIIDVAEVAAIAHEFGAKVVVDGVAYASHRAPDVAKWHADWYVFSNYKVYGPHMASLFGRNDAFAELTGPNHFFIPKDDVRYKFELGGASHEGCAALLGLRPYLNFLSGQPSEGEMGRSTIEAAYQVMQQHEFPLIEQLLSFLRKYDDIRIIGSDVADNERVGTVSFVHRSMSSKTIVDHLLSSGIAVRNGHMYAYRLCQALGLDPEDGVARVSFVHYNTSEEIDRCCSVLARIL
ncbi:MAG: Cysteine desulfurase SufS [Fimbriimonadaceae bacterium]|nr:Cysteine desulfurase SufS [Fimbriimonadaceae bacterium]